MGSRSPRNREPGDCLVVFGGRSEIGVEVAARLAADQTVILAARRPDDLADQTARLYDAGARAVHGIFFDADDTVSHSALIEQIEADYGPIGIAVVAFGILGDQRRAESDVEHALQIARTDYLAQVSVITILSAVMRARDIGTIIVFSSVAGVRVRRANYVYGSTKAGLDGFASGLADAVHGTGVRVLIARPGFVIGNMTAELMAGGTKPAPFSSTPAQVADAVVAGLDRGASVIWIPAILRPIFFAMRLLPRTLWRRMPR